MLLKDLAISSSGATPVNIINDAIINIFSDNPPADDVALALAVWSAVCLLVCLAVAVFLFLSNKILEIYKFRINGGRKIREKNNYSKVYMS